MQCAPGKTPCADRCFDLAIDRNNCGACGAACAASQARCDGGCADYAIDWRNCGACGTQCGSREACTNGSCLPCDDCDHDGYLPDAGDCCDNYDQCQLPWAANPGAHELPGNG